MKTQKENAELEMSKIAGRQGILYVLIEDEMISDCLENSEVKATKDQLEAIKELAHENLMEHLEQAIQDAVDEITND